jgi:hypothetical protein
MTGMALAVLCGLLGFGLLGAYEAIRAKIGRKLRKSLYAIGDDQFTMLLTGSKRIELDHRDSFSMMRDDESQGAPPFGVDLDRGTVYLPRPPTNQP